MIHRYNIGVALSTCVLLIAVGGLWDVYWWHEFVGRDNFWIPPHALAVIGAGSGVMLSLFYWYRTRQPKWRNVTLSFLVIVLAQPIDNLWHIFFGQEDSLSVAMYWSPPHTLIMIGTVLASVAVTRIAEDIERIALRYISHSLLLGSVFAATVLLLRPLLPTGTVYSLIGYFGPLPTAIVTVGCLELISRIKNVQYSAVVAVCGFGILHALSAALGVWMFIYHSEHSSNEILLSLLGGKNDIPGLLVWLAYILTAFWLHRARISWYRYISAGFILGVTQYSIGSYFLAEQFQFSATSSFIAILSSILGGAIAGFLLEYFHKK